MLSVTLHRPWPDAMLRWPADRDRWRKRVENRTWWPRRALGETIAIHAGKRYDREGEAFIASLADGGGAPGWEVPERHESPMGVVGTGLLCGIVQGDAFGNGRLIAGRRPHAHDGFVWMEWFMGGFGWLFDDLIALPRPVPCKGAQGLWTLPPDVAREVSAQVEEVRRAG